MRPNPTNFVGYGSYGQAALLQRKCSRGRGDRVKVPLKKCGLTARSISHKVCGIWTHLYILSMYLALKSVMGHKGLVRKLIPYKLLTLKSVMWA